MFVPNYRPLVGVDRLLVRDIIDWQERLGLEQIPLALDEGLLLGWNLEQVRICVVIGLLLELAGDQFRLVAVYGGNVVEFAVARVPRRN